MVLRGNQFGGHSLIARHRFLELSTVIVSTEYSGLDLLHERAIHQQQNVLDRTEKHGGPVVSDTEGKADSSRPESESYIS